jgi:NAD(P)-dependent dehydrogenase (short-subunit alcohol dehydrogenase family)
MAEGPTLLSTRLLVVGASSGIGRAFARNAIGQGADVCAVARRADRLTALCREAGGGHPMAGDVTDADACRRLVAEAAERMGGLDLVFYAAGAGSMAPISATETETWHADYAVNVIGPTRVCQAALPLLAAAGMITFVSSSSTSQTRWGLSSYAASKAALDATIRAWRMEHPERRFQRIVLGPTIPTDFGNSFDPDMLTTAMERWVASGVATTFMDTEDVGRHLAELTAVFLAHPDIDVPDLVLEARGAPWGRSADDRPL